MSQTTNTLAEAVTNRIRGLLAKTTENGATEAEALAAAAKARELMDSETVEHADEDEAAKLAGWVVERMVRFGIYPGWSISVRDADDE